MTPPLPTLLRAAHEAGACDKHAHARAMRACHLVLRDYAELIRGTDLAAITIRDGEVRMTLREDGTEIECDPADMGVPPVVALNFRRYEPRDAAFLLSLVEDGMTFLDIGANLGWYGVRVARRFPRARVIAFEPVPATFAFLERNIRHNGLVNMHAYPWGLFSSEGEQVFHVNPDMMGAASAGGPTSPRDDAMSCRVRTLDAVVAELRLQPDFIKMDVEGAELMVLQGGRETVACARPIIFAEMLRRHSAALGYHPNDIIALLADEGYRCFTMRGDRAEEFLHMDESTVETNFVFLHGDKHAMQISRLP